jgi:hypothetical protein
MTAWEKDRIARQTADLRVTFDMALSNKRKYPVAEFKAFVQSARRYIEITSGDPMIHRVSMGCCRLTRSQMTATAPISLLYGVFAQNSHI